MNKKMELSITQLLVLELKSLPQLYIHVQCTGDRIIG